MAIVTVLELAAEWKCSRKTIYRMVRAAVITPLKVGSGRVYKFDRESVQREIRRRGGLKL